MANKFAITAELQLALDTSIESKIDIFKKSINKSPLKLSLEITNEAFKSVYKDLNFLKKNVKSKPLNLSLKISDSEIKSVYKELAFLKRSVKSSPINIAVKVKDLQSISNTISSIKGKNISIGVSLKKDAIANISSLNSQLGMLDTTLNTLNSAKLNNIASSIQSISSSLKSLNRINGKKITFDIAAKDIKTVEALSNGLNRVSKSFKTAEVSGKSFNNMIINMASAIKQLQNNVSTINFSNINNAAKSIRSLSSQASVKTQNQLSQAVTSSKNAMYELGVQSGITLKRFGAYTLVTAGFFRLSFAIRNAVNEFIEYDKILTRVRQVTGQSVGATLDLSDQIGKLAVKYGVSSSSILNTSQVLAQAGFTTREVTQALEVLTKTEIAATFENIENTTEGAIAAMSQFNIKTNELESTLGSINAVSAAFAIESSDITTGIQKAGGAFSAAGGNLNEFIALLTTARSTTRESADTIAVGIRTITTRLQRLSTSNFLQDFGINIRRTADDVKNFKKEFGRTPDFKEGDFVGPFEALKRISEATSKIGGSDPRFAQIAEELAGFRQINKIIPLLREFEISQNAIQVALGGTNSLTKDAQIAQESYANQLTKVKEEFLSLVREIGQDETFRNLVKDLLSLTKVAIQVAKTFKDLIVPLGFFGVAKAGIAARSFIPGLKSSFLGRKDGGYIPGVGNKDSELIAAMPGEYVIKKSSAKKLGAGRLNLLNKGIIPAYASGGPIGNFLGSTKGLAVAGAVGFSIDKLGLVQEFDKLDDSVKNIVIGLGGLFAQISLMTIALKSFSKNVPKNSNYFRKATSEGLIQALQTKKSFTDRFNSGEEFLKQNNTRKTRLNSGNILNNLSTIDRRKTRNSIQASGIREEFRQRLLISGSDTRSLKLANQNTQKLLQAKIIEYAQEEAKIIKSTKVDPRSFAAKQGLTQQFSVRDTQTNTTRQFNTRAAASKFAVSRGLIKDDSEITSLQNSISNRSKQINRINANKRGFISANNIVQSGKTAPNLNQANLLGRSEGRIESVRQSGITARISQKLLQDEIAKSAKRRGLSSISGISAKTGAFLSSQKGLGVGVAASLAGGFAGDLIKNNNRPTETSSGSKLSFAAGGAISSAASLGALGGTIGTLIAPGIGTAVGVALGGIAGATYGAIKSINEFDSTIANVASNKSIKSLENIFESITSGKTSARTSSFGVISNLNNLKTTLQSTSDKEIRENVLSSLENQKVNIANFISDLSKASKSYKSFSQRVDEGSQRFIAGIIGIPFSEFQDNIKKQIETSNKFDNAFQAGINAVERFDNSVRSVLRFSEAFTIASQRVNSFTDNLESFASGSGGNTRLRNTLSPSLSNIQNGFNVSGIQDNILSFTNQFGQAGQNLGKTASDIVKVTNVLPDILLGLKASSALDPSGDVSGRFGKALENANIGKDVKQLLLSRLEDLLGADNTDSQFFSNLTKDFPKAIQSLLEGTKPVVEAISSAYEISTTRLNEFSSSLEKLRNFDKAILEGRNKLFDNSSLIQSRGFFSGRNVDSALLRNQRSLTSLNTGGLSAQQLRGNIISGRSNVQGLTSRLESTENIQLKAQIQIALEKERSAIEKNVQALNYLADSTGELSILQNQLNRAQSERLNKRDFALDFASSSGEERSRLSRIVSGARGASATGSLSGVSQDIKKDVIGFLKTYADSIVGNGKTGNEVLNSIANSTSGLPTGFNNTGTPSTKEIALQSQIEDAFAKQKEAQQFLNSTLISDRQLFSQQLNKDMQSFFKELQKILQEGETRDLKNQIFSTQAKLQDTVQKRDTLGNIRSRFGENALNNAQDIKSVNDTFNQFGSVPSIVSGILSKLPEVQRQAIGGNTFTKNLFGKDQISKDVFNKTAGSLIQNLRPEQIDQIRQDLQKGDIGANLVNNTVDGSKAFSILKTSLENISKEASGKLLSANDSRSRLVQDVGGTKRFNTISKDIQSKDSILLKSLNDFPKDASLGQLNSEISNLNGQLQALNSAFSNNRPRLPIRRNSGGIVPGFGNSDTVPALLTPGEFVFSKNAVKNIGIKTLRQANSGAVRFNRGGLIQQSNNAIINSEGINKFNMAIGQLGVQIQNMKDAIAAIPTEITMTGSHRLDVFINGAQAFAQMKPEFENLIKQEIKNSINKLIKTKMPKLGNFEG